jgi:hypothetical protein
MRALAWLALAWFTPPVLAAQWTVSVSKDSTGGARAAFRLVAEPLPMQSVRPEILFHCAKGAVEDASVLTQVMIQHDSDVVLRWDAGAATPEHWPRSSDLNGFVAPQKTTFVDNLLHHRLLNVRYRPTGQYVVTPRFNLSGLGAQDAALKLHCGITATKEKTSR